MNVAPLPPAAVVIPPVPPPPPAGSITRQLVKDIVERSRDDAEVEHWMLHLRFTKHPGGFAVENYTADIENKMNLFFSLQTGGWRKVEGTTRTFFNSSKISKTTAKAIIGALKNWLPSVKVIGNTEPIVHCVLSKAEHYDV